MDYFDFFEEQEEKPLRHRFWAAFLNLLSFGLFVSALAAFAFVVYLFLNPYSPYNPLPPEFSILLPSAPSPTVGSVDLDINDATNTPESTTTETSTPIPVSELTFTETPTPVPTVVTELSFAVIGDYGIAGENLAAVSDLIDSWDVDYLITVGDNNYPDGEAITIDRNVGQYFHQYIHPYQGEYGPGAETNRFFPTLGNHDWNKETGFQAYMEYFELPGNERYYEVELDFVHLFALSSDPHEPDGNREGSIQAQWLQEALAASTAPWKVVYFHHTPYSSGDHGGYSRMRWPFMEWGADVVIAGHDHDYERLEIGGLTYFVNGLGGRSRYPFNVVQLGSQVRYQARYGAMLVEATSTTMTFQFINIDEEVIDTHVIEK